MLCSTFFDSFLYESKEKKGKKKIKEVINYWVCDLSDVIANDVSRLINNQSDKQAKNTYGYSLKDGNTDLGCDVSVGSDHGQGACRCCAKLNLLSPQVCRSNNSVSYGSRQFLFAHIECKKDTAEILNKIADRTNSSLQRLNFGKLIGIRDRNK